MWLHLTLSMKVSYSQPLLPKFKFQINPVKQFWIFFLTEKKILQINLNNFQQFTQIFNFFQIFGLEIFEYTFKPRDTWLK